jgi:hypothetical protein
MICMKCITFRLILVASEDGQLRPNSSRTMALGSSQPRNEYQESSWGVDGGRPELKADNLTAICEAIV